MIGRSLPTGYLSIGLKDKGVHHGCVIIKEHDDKIAIIDWDAITAKEEKITFLPFKEVKEILELKHKLRRGHEKNTNTTTNNKQFHIRRRIPKMAH
jgi:Leucine-rich repeat (LRR) protein